MNVKEAIDLRKSVRKWQDKSVPKEIITELIDAARKAPSAKNTQSHKYYIIQKSEIDGVLKEKGVFKRPFVYDAPLIIVCAADPKEYPASTDVDESPEHYAYIDLSIAASFMMLRATELGLGSVFVAWIYRDKLKEALNIPKDYIVPFVIPVGYPDEIPAGRPRKSIEEILINK